MAEIKEIQKSKIEYNDILALLQDNIFSRLNCHNIGRVIEFDPDTYTATVELMQIKQFYNESFRVAPITDVPLIIFGAGAGHITLPDPTGTICLLFFIDRNIDRFLETEEAYTPATARMHSMSDCIALTTFKTLANPLKQYDDKAISIFMSETMIKIFEGIIELFTPYKDSITLGNQLQISSETEIVLNAPNVKTTGNLNVATGYSGVVPCGLVTLAVTNGIVTGVS